MLISITLNRACREIFLIRERQRSIREIIHRVCAGLVTGKIRTRKACSDIIPRVLFIRRFALLCFSLILINPIVRLSLSLFLSSRRQKITFPRMRGTSFRWKGEGGRGSVQGRGSCRSGGPWRVSLKAPKNPKPETRREQSKCPATIESSAERDRKVAYRAVRP